MKFWSIFAVAAIFTVNARTCVPDNIVLLDGTIVSGTVTSYDFNDFTLTLDNGKSQRIPGSAVFLINFERAPNETTTRTPTPTQSAPPKTGGSSKRHAPPFPTPAALTAAVTRARLTADIPWRQSRIGNDFLAIYRNFNGPSGNFVSSAKVGGNPVNEYNEVNCMMEGPTKDRVDKITVEAECYNEARSHLQNTLRIFVGVLKEIDPQLPADALSRLAAAMDRPQTIGRWEVKAETHRAGTDIVATMKR